VGQQEFRGREVEDGDGHADDGNVPANDWGIVVRLPDDDECEERAEERREQGEQQHDQRDHHQVGDIVGEARKPNMRPSGRRLWAAARRPR
jgi:hypothetical protein